MLLPLLAAASGLALAAAPGCTGTIGGANPGQGGAGNGGQGGAGGGTPDPAALFAELEPDLLMACGGCHGTSGSVSTHLFLADPVYDNVKAWSGIVVKNYEASKFLTYASGSMTTHSGPELEGDLLAKVTAWLQAEAILIDDAPPPEPTIPLVGPFDVRTTGTPNIVYFHNYLGVNFTGIALTFTATIDGMGGLAVRGLKVIAAEELGVHMVRPQVQMFQGAGSGTTVAEGTGYDMEVLGGESVDLDPLDVDIPNWPAGAKLGILFQTAEPVTGQGTTQCNALAEFQASAMPALQGSCLNNCHGSAGSPAASVMDLSTMAADAAGACRTVRVRSNLMTPAMSLIFTNTDPGGGSNHPFQFGGDATAFGTFETDVTTWLTAEAAASP